MTIPLQFTSLYDVCNWINQNTAPSVNTEVTEKLVVLWDRDSLFPGPVMDLIILFAKYYIYTSKLRETVPSVEGFKYIV